MVRNASDSSVYAEVVKPLPMEDLQHVLEDTRPLWEAARRSRIFLSGGTGFFGAWLLESLAYCNRELKLDLKATVLSRNPDGFLRKMPHLAGESSIVWLQGDVRDFKFPGQRFDFVIHGAAPTTADKAQLPSDLMATLVHGTERMLGFTRSCGARQLLFLSSGAVYGKQPQDLSRMPETYLGGPDWLDADSVYAEGKRVSELMCSLFAQETGVQCAIARCFAFVGPHLPLDQHFAIGNFIADALSGRQIAITATGRQCARIFMRPIWLSGSGRSFFARPKLVPIQPYSMSVRVKASAFATWPIQWWKRSTRISRLKLQVILLWEPSERCTFQMLRKRKLASRCAKE